MKTYTQAQHAMQWYVANLVATDPRAVKRGVSHITVHLRVWRQMGRPFGIRVFDRHVPIDATGTDPAKVSWRYKPRRPRVWRQA